jgi:CRISPR/Cas system CSM-associated protein Csm2 small subunit
MKKKCEQCGKDFEPLQPHFKTCRSCHFSQDRSSPTAPLNSLLLPSFYDSSGNLIKGVFIDTPTQLASIFANDNPNLASKQLRDFYNIILKARNKSILKGIDVVKPILWECQRNAEYQMKRNVIPRSFFKFLEHHIKLAETSEKTLDGFCQHIQSIIAYYPKEKGER